MLLIGILALGVAVFLSIRLANRAAVAGFELFSENVTGTSDLILTSPAGQFDTAVLLEIRSVLDELLAGLYPVLEATVSEFAGDPSSSSSRTFHVVGVDLAAL